MTPTEINNLAHEIADKLIGQCVRSIDSELEDRGMDITSAPANLLIAIDDLVFCCDCCGWYYSTNELHNDHGSQLCNECAITTEETGK